MNSRSIPVEVIISIAEVIARCDFRTTVFRCITNSDSPWIITVGESSWQRHLIVEETSIGISGSDATMAILSVDESNKFGYDINVNNIEKRICLSELVAEGYVGVWKSLRPGAVVS